MKIYSIILSISFFTAMAMDDDSWLSSFNAEKSSDGKERTDELLDYLGGNILNDFGYGDGESASSIGEESKHEENDTETGPCYANCPLCYRFFKKADKSDMQEALKEHLEESHHTVLSDTKIDEYIRKFIGNWKVICKCPYRGSLNPSGRTCSYDFMHIVSCDTTRKPFYHLIDHYRRFHAYETDLDAVGNNKDAIQISGPFQAEQDSSCNQGAYIIKKKRTPFLYLQKRPLHKKHCTYKITYKCPLHGKKLKKDAYNTKESSACNFFNEIIETIDTGTTQREFNRFFNTKIHSIISNMWRHLSVQHEGTWTQFTCKEKQKWREDTRKIYVSWQELEEVKNQ